MADVGSMWTLDRWRVSERGHGGGLSKNLSRSQDLKLGLLILELPLSGLKFLFHAISKLT